MIGYLRATCIIVITEIKFMKKQAFILTFFSIFFGGLLLHTLPVYASSWQTYDYNSLTRTNVLCTEFDHSNGCDGTSNGGLSWQEFETTSTITASHIYTYENFRVGNVGVGPYLIKIYNNSNTLLATYTGSVPTSTPNNTTYFQWLDAQPTSTPFTFNSGSKYYIQVRCDPAQCGGGFFQDAGRWSAHAPSTTYTNADHWDGAQTSNVYRNYDATLIVSGSAIAGLTSSTPQLAMTSPTDGSYVPLTTTITGTCPNNGAHQVYVTYGSNLSYITSGTFDLLGVSCTNNQFSTTTTIQNGLQEFNVIDRSWLDNATQPAFGCANNNICVYALNGVDANYSWLLGIISPQDDGTHTFTNIGYASGTLPFRFKYNRPSNVSSTKVFFGLNETNSNYSGTIQTLVNATLFTLDSNNNGYVDVSNLTSSSTTKYYTATLSWNSVVYYSLNFNITGSVSGTVVTVPGQKDYGYWGNIARDIFIPQQSTIEQFTVNLPDMLHNKIFIGYYYQVKDVWNYTPSSTPLSISFDIPIPGGVTTSFQIMDSQNSTLQGFANTMRPISQAVMWAVVVIYIIETIRHQEL